MTSDEPAPAPAGTAPETRVVTRREVLGATTIAVVLALAMNAPVTAHIGSRLPGDVQDPALQAWQIAWGGHALRTDPAGFFDANTFWPLKGSLAFSDALIGYAPTALLGEGPGIAVLRYDLLYLLTFVLAFLGAYLLARELGAGHGGALVAGVAFAYAPYRLSQVRHLNVLSTGGVPLALFLLRSGYRRRAPRALLAGWAVAAWQVSLGFGIGMPFVYLLAAGTIVVLLRSRARARDRKTTVAFVGGAAVFAVVSLLLAAPYVATLRAHPEARRTQSEVRFFSPTKASVLAAASTSTLWGRTTAPFRERLRWPEEQTLFPGLIAPALAAVGAVTGRASRAVRIALVAGGAGAALLALGFGVADGWLGYRLAYHLPGWQGIRTPGRLMVFVTLALAVLAALGASRLLDRTRRRGALLGLMLALILLDGAGSTPTAPVPTAPAARAPAPQVHLPFAPGGLYMLWSTDGFPPIVNGSSGVVPRFHQDLLPILTGFPDRASVEELRAIGVSTVLLHTDMTQGTPWESAARRDVRGLGLRLRLEGSTLVYDLSG